MIRHLWWCLSYSRSLKNGRLFIVLAIQSYVTRRMSVIRDVRVLRPRSVMTYRSVRFSWKRTLVVAGYGSRGSRNVALPGKLVYFVS